RDPAPAQLAVEGLEAVRLRPTIFLDGGPSEEFRRSALRLRALPDEHAVRCEAAEKNLSSARAGIEKVVVRDASDSFRGFPKPDSRIWSNESTHGGIATSLNRRVMQG